ncbi:hypothetical protein [Streptomyces sp. ML-6]|uniref:hypothetical protein n=1 Tax=Streptomyces sp. ML-6 TaxID=2982693 RepID=UPI0032DECA24
MLSREPHERGRLPATGVHDASGRRAAPPADLATALTACTARTAGSAHVNGHDDTGSLRPGTSPAWWSWTGTSTRAPPEEIAGARVERTYVGGRFVHAS